MAQPYHTDEQLILAAKLYFIDGLPQPQIGKLVDVSESKASRRLARAREQGFDYEPGTPDTVCDPVLTGLRISELGPTLG